MGGGATLEAEARLGPVVEVRRYRFDNELRAILAPDPSRQRVAYQSWFGFGSADDRPGKTGLAHLLEHMLCIGAGFNAATWRDWTYYHVTCSPRLLGRLIERDAFNLVALGFRRAQVFRERDVVVQEHTRNQDPEALVYNALYRLLFGDHPYATPTIGLLEDIVRIDERDLDLFHRHFYVPNNACLVVAGPFDEAEVLERIGEHFRRARRRTLPSQSWEIPAPGGERREALRRPEVSVPRVAVGYPAVAKSSDDWLACALLAEVVGDRLHDALNRAGSASVTGAVAFSRMPGLLTLLARANRDLSIDQVCAAIDEVIDRVATYGVTTGELEGTRRAHERRSWERLVELDGRARMLGEYEMVHGDFRGLTGDLERLPGVDVAAVNRLASRVFQRPRAVVTLEAGEP